MFFKFLYLVFIKPLYNYHYFSVKNMGTAKGYLFRVFAHSATAFTASDEFKYPMPPNIKKRAITAGLIGKLCLWACSLCTSRELTNPPPLILKQKIKKEAYRRQVGFRLIRQLQALEGLVLGFLVLYRHFEGKIHLIVFPFLLIFL